MTNTINELLSLDNSYQTFQMMKIFVNIILTNDPSGYAQYSVTLEYKAILEQCKAAYAVKETVVQQSVIHSDIPIAHPRLHLPPSKINPSFPPLKRWQMWGRYF